MRLQPVLLLDDPNGHSGDPHSSPRQPAVPRPLSRRALLAAALGGGAALGAAALLPGGGPAPGPSHRPAAVDPLARLERLSPEGLLALHQGLVFAVAWAPDDDPRVDPLIERLLAQVLENERSTAPRLASLQADAALSLVVLAQLRGGPRSLLAALPRLEAIR